MPDVDPTELSVEIARPIEEHARQVMVWRNDPVTLANFYHREPKVWQSFWPEFRDKYFPEDTPTPIFVCRKGVRVAFLRFEAIQDGLDGRRRCDISINVDPALRNKGLGVSALRIATDYLRSRGIDEVLAEIRVENQASARAFERAGYVRIDKTVKHIADTGETCQIYRYSLKVQ